MRHKKWDKALFVHWPRPPARVQALLPDELQVDTLHGEAYVGLVLLTEEQVGPVLGHGLGLGVTHQGANVRTYVRAPNGEREVFFFSLECSSTLLSYGARVATMPYVPAEMARGEEQGLL